MKIVELRAENFKCLRAVRIRPVTGKNGAGKTSVLDAVAAAIGGADFAARMPVRRGQARGEVSVDLGDLRVTRKFVVGKDGATASTLVVENRDGFRSKSPQHVLDELAGRLTLDPLEFMRARAEDRVRMIESLVPGFDFPASARAEKESRDRRTEVNRVLRARVASRSSIALPDGPRPVRPDTASLTIALGEAENHNARIRDQREIRERYAEKTEELAAEAAALRARVNLIDREVGERKKKLADLPALGAPKDTTEIKKNLSEAAGIIEACALHERVEQLDADAARFAGESEVLTQEIERLAGERAAAVAGASLPDGVRIDGDDVTLDGIPFDQASAAEQLRVSAGIAMALNPKLRVILVRDGSLLDADGMRTIAEMAEKNDFQVWLERVAHGERAGVVIEDGEVAP